MIYDSSLSQDITLRRVVFASLPVLGRLKEVLKMQLFNVHPGRKTPRVKSFCFRELGDHILLLELLCFVFFCPFFLTLDSFKAAHILLGSGFIREEREGEREREQKTVERKADRKKTTTMNSRNKKKKKK